MITRVINSMSALSNELCNFAFAQAAQKLSAIKVYIDFIYLLWLISFEPLELKQSHVLHLKVLMVVINAS